MTTRLTKLQVLDYALEGARLIRGLYSGAMSEKDEADLNADIKELQRRIELCELAEERKETSHG